MDDKTAHGPAAPEITGPPRRRINATSVVVKILALLGICVLVVALLLPAQRNARGAARRNQCMNHMKQISLALHSYAEVHGALPPAYTTDADGNPLHSWRTLILPFLEEQQLYQLIDLTKPWNDPVNAEALQTSLPVYQCPSSVFEDGTRTTYLAIVTPHSCLRPAEPRNLADITDGASRTWMVIEVDDEHAVPWMSPVDADENLVLSLAGPNSTTAHPGGWNAAFVDGRVTFSAGSLPAATRRALISIAGDDAITDRDPD